MNNDYISNIIKSYQVGMLQSQRAFTELIYPLWHGHETEFGAIAIGLLINILKDGEKSNVFYK